MKNKSVETILEMVKRDDEALEAAEREMSKAKSLADAKKVWSEYTEKLRTSRQEIGL